MRAIGSTGAPLSAEGFRWIGDAVGDHVQICSVSGGTDVCAAFVAAAPLVPVWLGELSCAALGAAVVAYDEAGEEIIDEVGELVITAPMPSMPVSFWNDPDGTRLREAYYEDYPGVWRHGDWIRRTPRGSYVIYGRSDSTLNRGGVRMGTADFYAVTEGFDEVLDSHRRRATHPQRQEVRGPGQEDPGRRRPGARRQPRRPAGPGRPSALPGPADRGWVIPLEQAVYPGHRWRAERPREASPSLVYGAALLMRFGVTPHPGFKSRSLRAGRPLRGRPGWDN
jgi:hypothetical protein